MGEVVTGQLEGRTAIITGAGRGIGAAVAQRFCQEGSNVVVADIDVDTGESIAASLVADGHSATFERVDISDADSVESMVGNAAVRYGGVDILVNNAGVLRPSSIRKMAPEDWDLSLAVNLTGTANCIQHTVPRMIEAGYGRIINTTSIAGIDGIAGQTAYSTTKGGLIAMTHTLAKELGPRGITVNAIAPGMIDTEISSGISEERRIAVASSIPVGRIGTPDDLAPAFVLLASEEAGYINGAVLTIDGGGVAV